MQDIYMKTSFKLLKNKLAVILIFLAAILISCGNNSEMGNANNGERLIPSVEAVQAHFGSLPLSERLTGVVRAKNQVAIYPEISAAITDVYVHNGEMVKKGQPLVRLRDREFQERLNQAKAEYQIAVAQAKQAGARLKEVKSELQRICLLYTSPSPRDRTRSRMPSSA